MPEVRKFLTVSASHLPLRFAKRLEADASESPAALVLAGYYGYLVFTRGEHPDYPASVKVLLAYAATNLDCSFVLFDSDGDVLDGLAVYNEAIPGDVA